MGVDQNEMRIMNSTIQLMQATSIMVFLQTGC